MAKRNIGTIVSFFSGCGGLDLGFVGGFNYRNKRIGRTGLEILAAYDSSPHAIASYRRNVDKRAYCVDLANADVSQFPSADVLLGGFPCQEFSRCGPRRGLESKRGKLYKAMVEYASLHQPLVVVGENVSDLLYINEGWDFRVIRSSFRRVGYRCLTWNVNAVDYGVPQHRKRVFVVFVREDIQHDPDAPEPTHLGSWRSAEWAISDLMEVRSDAVANQSQFFRAAKAGRGHGQGDEVTPRNAPAFTVRANAKSRIQFHFELPRRLTVRECARLQTFPDRFVFQFSATENVRQIGNAVPPLLANAVARQIVQFIERATASESRTGVAK